MGPDPEKGKEIQEKYFSPGIKSLCYKRIMRNEIPRTIFTVLRRDGGWLVEHEGEDFGHSTDREITRAFAYKRAQELSQSGKACQVLVSGEHGAFGPR